MTSNEKLSLKVSACPEKDLVYENCLFVSKENGKKLQFKRKSINHLKIISAKSITIYEAKIHRAVNGDKIAMSKISRQACSANTGETVIVEQFEIDEKINPNLVWAFFSVRLLSGTFSLKESEIESILNDRFNNVILSRGAIYIFDASGQGAFSLTVESLKVADPKWAKKSTNNIIKNGIKDSKNGDKFANPQLEKEKMVDDEMLKVVDFGVLTKHTFIELKSESKTLVIEPSDSNKQLNLFGPKWRYSQLGIGGLGEEFNSIFRRAFASRTLPPNVVKRLGVEHVRGLLLYGPPGTGKTLMARQIGKMLHGKKPKLVNGPEILNKYVGQSEENIRALFQDAESDFKKNGENSDLHVIIFDEIDAICKQRGTASGSTGVHDTVVNQLLSKMDGVDSLNNILVIGMTNRKDMIDSALLRPGRFEVHVEIGLPDKKGRTEILKIHTKTMRENGFLGKNVDFDQLAERTKNFSGAEIAGLVKSATSFACYGSLDVSKESGRAEIEITAKEAKNIKVEMSHFLGALKEVKSAFGVSQESLAAALGQGIIEFSEVFKEVFQSSLEMIKNLEKSQNTSLLTILLSGEIGSGKSALAAHLVKNSAFPFSKIISAADFIGWNESSKCFKINSIFEDAFKSPLSVLIIDDIERILGYVDIGPRFSNLTLQTLLVLLRKTPPWDKKKEMPRKLCIIGTTSNEEIMSDVGLKSHFMSTKKVPFLTKRIEIERVLASKNYTANFETMQKIEALIEKKGIGIKPLLTVLEMAANSQNEILFEEFRKNAANFDHF